jgi:plastocyanin
LSPQLHTQGLRLAVSSLVLFGSLTLVACSATAGAAQPSGAATPVPPAALSTLPPAKPPAAAQSGAGPSVAIENFNYVSADLTVPVGSTVVWTNHDDVEHTVTASDNSFSSPSISTDGQFSHTFGAPGTYTYFCAIHPFMTARVTVQ